MGQSTVTYVTILQQSLERKKEYLSNILLLSKRQGELAKEDNFLEEFSKIVEQKDIYINNVNEIDKGFSSVYERVRREIRDNVDLYREALLKIQQLIRECVELGVEIEATEERNKQTLERVFASEYKGVRQVKQSKSVANKYYKSMSAGIVNDSFLYDKKK